MAEPNTPPAHMPPETYDPETGAFSIAFEPNMLQYSKILKGCCWRQETLAPFGPECVQLTAARSVATVPQSLQSRGIDQIEFQAMLNDVKRGLADSAPFASFLCIFPLGFTLVLIPVVFILLCCMMRGTAKAIDGATTNVESAIAQRADAWRTRYGVDVRVVRDVRYTRPTMPAEDALYGFKSFNIVSSEWTGAALSMTPVAR